MEVMDVDQPQTNGHANGKRKSRGSINQSYKDASSSEGDDQPLVGAQSMKTKSPNANIASE
jgi:DNA topoisomerase-1